MKKNIINFLLCTTLLIVGCKKEDARYPFDISLKRVPYVNVTVDATGSAAIDLTNLATFNGKFSINLLYPGDVHPDKVDVVIRKNGDNTTVKLLQAGVATFPTNMTITAAQVATLFGAAIKLGDNYDVGVDIYTADGTKYEAFPLGTGVQAYGGTGQTNQPGWTATIRYSAICAYDPTIYQGNFKAKDAFGDANGAILVLTKIDNTHFSFIYPSVLNPKPIIVTVNPNNNTASIAANSVIGSVWDPAFGYAGTETNPTVNSASGTVAPCDKTVTLSIQWGFSNGAQQWGGGPYSLVLTKQ